jgi:hypothetical protein
VTRQGPRQDNMTVDRGDLRMMLKSRSWHQLAVWKCGQGCSEALSLKAKPLNWIPQWQRLGLANPSPQALHVMTSASGDEHGLKGTIPGQRGTRNTAWAMSSYVFYGINSSLLKTGRSWTSRGRGRDNVYECRSHSEASLNRVWVVKKENSSVEVAGWVSADTF